MKKQLGPRTIVHLHPVFVIGTYDRERRPNIMTASWGGISCSLPPCISISLRKATYTYGNIIKNEAFTVNIPSARFVKEVDYIGMNSGRKVDKFEKTSLTPIRSSKVNAPYVLEFPYALECELFKTTELGLHTQFVGRIIDIIASEEILGKNGKPDIEKTDPFFWGSEGNNEYYTIGKSIGGAFSIGKEVK